MVAEFREAFGDGEAKERILCIRAEAERVLGATAQAWLNQGQERIADFSPLYMASISATGLNRAKAALYMQAIGD